MGGKKSKKQAVVTAETPKGRSRWLKQEAVQDVPAAIQCDSGAASGLKVANTTDQLHEALPADCRGRSRGRHGARETPLTPISRTVDRHACYEQSVQEPRKEIANVMNMHREATLELSRRREVRDVSPPRKLKEDFCGTAILCREWVLRNVQNVAYGVDLDPAVVEYAHTHTLREAKGGSVEDRVQLFVGDVLSCDLAPKSDIVIAMNYGCFYFHRRSDLVRYLRRCVASLRQPGGVFVCDAFAGSKTGAKTKMRTHGWFTSYFEHKSLDIMTNVVKTALHFRFEDGSWMRNAFTYDFRMYTIVELREAMMDAGFKETFVWVSPTREKDNEAGDKTENGDEGDQETDEEGEEVEDYPCNEYIRVDQYTPQMESYNAYVVGLT